MLEHGDAEAAAFEALNARLVALWGDVFPADDRPYTSVVVPSLSLPPDLLAHSPVNTSYEERLLFLLMRLRNPFARLVYVTSQPIHPMIVEYYLQLVGGITASQAQRRLTLLSVHDSSARPLTEKLIERPRVMDRVRAAIPDPMRAYLTVPISSSIERTLAVRLGIPLNAPDPRLVYLGTKSWRRRLFRQTGIPLPDGAEDLHDEAQLLDALGDLRRRQPALRAAVLKLDDHLAGEGNAIFTYPGPDGNLKSALMALQTAGGWSGEQYLETFRQHGGVAEELIEGASRTSPSVQVRINPKDEVFVTSTHEQILSGRLGQSYRACEFPARRPYRAILQQHGVTVGRALAERGVRGRLSIDFVAVPSAQQDSWRVAALEINLRMGGTTHPMLALRSLSDGRFDPESGRFLASDGSARYYYATDALESSAYRGLVPEDVVEIVTLHRLGYDPRDETGVVFHTLGGVSEHGRLGVVAIGGSRRQAHELYTRAADVLGEETGSRPWTVRTRKETFPACAATAPSATRDDEEP